MLPIPEGVEGVFPEAPLPFETRFSSASRRNAVERRITLDGKELRVTLTAREGERFYDLQLKSEGEDETIPIDLVKKAKGWYSLLVGGRSYEVFAGKEGERCTIRIGDRRYDLKVSDDRAARKKARKGGGDGLLTAVMPGKVVALLVEPKERVERGQPVVVLEAMKMENELKSPIDGEVAQIFVKPGDSVEANARLVLIVEA